MNIELFGKKISLRTEYCKLYNFNIQPVLDPYINIFVRFKGCNAKCTFCEFADTANHFNLDKFIEIIKEVKKQIFVKKVAFTGGEPTLNMKQFKEIVSKTREILDKPSFVLNTNGINLKEVYTDDILPKYINNISLSRHHYDDTINNKILGFNSISNQDLKSLQDSTDDKDLIHLSCNIIKGYIDSKEEVYKYLEFTNQIGIRSAGLVSLMPINQYCIDNFVDIAELDLKSKRFNITKETTYKDICRCKNYVYIPQSADDIVRVYYKNTYKPYDIVENIVFDGEYLRVGFSGDILF